MLFDLFICHASEDKDDFARPLVDALRAAHLEVWYDEISIQLGQSLRESIDLGLSRSRHGVVVLSPAFFAKRWTQRELNGLVARQMQGEDQVILPVWHGLSAAEISKHSPPLADLKAVDSTRGLAQVCAEILKVVRPEASPLIAARDELLAWGTTPPVITDEWWLDVVEASNRVPACGAAVPESASWGRWSFPLPNGERGRQRGVRLAWTAMQLRWVQAADERRITQLTHPEQVLAFIDEMPGLFETCEDYPRYLAMYAPQLTIPGMSGQFEETFEKLSADKKIEEMILRNHCCAAATSETLRDQEYLESLAYHWVSSGTVFGPPTRTHEAFDYTVWLFTDASAWLPGTLRDDLRNGFKQLWGSERKLFGDYEETHALLSLPDLRKSGAPAEKTVQGLRELIGRSLARTGIDGDAGQLTTLLIEFGFLAARWRERRRPRPVT